MRTKGANKIQTQTQVHVKIQIHTSPVEQKWYWASWWGRGGPAGEKEAGGPEPTCSESLKLSWKFESLSPHPMKVWSYHENLKVWPHMLCKFGALMKVWTQVPHALKVWAQIRRPTNKEMAYMGSGKNTDEPAVAKKKLTRKDTNQSITAVVHVLCTMNLILLLCRSSHNLDSFSITCLPKEMNGYFLHQILFS